MAAPSPETSPTLEADEVQALFERYARLFNDALAGRPDAPAIAALYADAFIASSPRGVLAGRKDAAFQRMMTDGFQRYRDLGTRTMELKGVRTTRIDDAHLLAQVDWNAVYTAAHGEQAIPFTNVYLVRAEAAGPRVFGWITGDEEAAMREHGIG